MNKFLFFFNFLSVIILYIRLSHLIFSLSSILWNSFIIEIAREVNPRIMIRYINKNIIYPALVLIEYKFSLTKLFENNPKYNI